MSRKYSNKTLDELARFVEARFTNTEMDSIFLYVSVPDGFDFGSNKLARSLNVLKQLSRSEEETHDEILDELFNEIIKRKQGAFEPPKYSWDSQDELATSLRRALRADGYELIDGGIMSSDKIEFELASEVSLLESNLQKQGMDDVARTLDQAHKSFIDGRFEACNAMLRTSLEATLKNVAIKIAGDLSNIPASNLKYGATPTDIRKYLHQQGFFVQDEIGYIREFYGYASTVGSHPGLSNESESRLRRLMIVALIQYCLEKLISKYP